MRRAKPARIYPACFPDFSKEAVARWQAPHLNTFARDPAHNYSHTHLRVIIPLQVLIALPAAQSGDPGCLYTNMANIHTRHSITQLGASSSS